MKFETLLTYGGTALRAATVPEHNALLINESVIEATFDHGEQTFQVGGFINIHNGIIEVEPMSDVELQEKILKSSLHTKVAFHFRGERGNPVFVQSEVIGDEALLTGQAAAELEATCLILSEHKDDEREDA